MSYRTPPRRAKVNIEYGDDILAGPYPQSMSEFIGQDEAKEALLSEILASHHFGRPMRHTMLASGLQGIGKTALARLTAHTAKVGFVNMGGTSIKEEEVINALSQMKDYDILFLDEVHRLMAGGRARMEWLLTLLQDGVIQTPRGPFRAPKITVIAATTDAEKLPPAVLDRFGVKPQLDEYGLDEAAEIAEGKARSIGYGTTLPSGMELPWPTDPEFFEEVAKATDRNPRRIGQLLQTVAATYFVEPEVIWDGERYDLSPALKREGLTADGMTREQVAYLLLLLEKEVCGLSTLKAALSLPELGLTERLLIRRGYIDITPSGRAITDWGIKRAEQLATDKLADEAANLTTRERSAA